MTRLALSEDSAFIDKVTMDVGAELNIDEQL